VLRIAVSGYYGFKNAGDDAILMALVTTIRALAPGAEITVLSHSPAETRQLYGVRAINRWNPFGIIWTLLRSDLLLSGGGGLLQDVTGVRSICYYLVVVALALAVGKPVVYYAQGVGPVRTRFGRWLTRIVSNRVDLITVRDQASRDDLLAMGICRPPLVVTADPVLALNPSQINNAGGAELLETLRLQGRLERKGTEGMAGEQSVPVSPAGEEEPAVPNTQGTQDSGILTHHSASIPDPKEMHPPRAGHGPGAGNAGHRLGIVVRDWSDDARYKKCIAAVADRFVRDGWEAILVPFHYPADVQACNDVSLLMQEPGLLVGNWLTVGALFGLLGELDLVLAMRLHAIVMASVMRVPCVGISYDPKVERFLELTGQPNAGSTTSLEEEQLYRMLLDTWERRQEIAANLDKVLAYLRQQAWETASLTLSVFYARFPKKRREPGRPAGRARAGAPAGPGTAGETPRGSTAGRNRNAKQ
jgi:polysaccharide pyruvyl transferase WcaK-like protein